MREHSYALCGANLINSGKRASYSSEEPNRRIQIYRFEITRSCLTCLLLNLIMSEKEPVTEQQFFYKRGKLGNGRKILRDR